MTHDEGEASSASPWAPLRHSVYRSLWAGALLSNIGTWMHDIAAGWTMMGLNPSPVFVPLLQTAGSLPMFLLALPGGALADILDRRRLLAGSLAGIILVIAVLGLLTVLGWTSGWVLLVMTFLIGVGNGISHPASDALTPEVVEPRDLPQALSLDSVGLNLARAIGGALGGFLTAVVGPGGVFLMNAAASVPLPLTLLGWKRPTERTSLPPESIRAALKTGIRYVRHAPELRVVLLRVLCFIIPACALWSLMPLLVRSELKLSAIDFGLVVGAFGVGALSGAQILPIFRHRTSPNALFAGSTLVFAGVLFSLAVARSFPIVVGTMAIAGIAWLALNSTLNIALQRSIPSWVRARGAALFGLTFMGGMTMGSTLWGVITAVSGTRTALASAGALAVAGALVGLRYPLPGRVLNLLPSLHWPSPTVSAGEAALDMPAEVTVEYRIDPDRAQGFRAAMEKLEHIRRRDGSREWKLEVDPADASHYIEIFTFDSWADHLRQHERVTVEDRTLEEITRSFHVGRTAPVVTHRILSRETEQGTDS